MILMLREMIILHQYHFCTIFTPMTVDYTLEVTYNVNTSVTSNWLPFINNSTTIGKRDKSSYSRISLTNAR